MPAAAPTLRRRKPTAQPSQNEVTHTRVDAVNESNERIKLCKIKVPIQIFTHLANVANVEVDDKGGMIMDDDSRTELDSQRTCP